MIAQGSSGIDRLCSAKFEGFSGELFSCCVNVKDKKMQCTVVLIECGLEKKIDIKHFLKRKVKRERQAFRSQAISLGPLIYTILPTTTIIMGFSCLPLVYNWICMLLCQSGR